MHRYLLALLVLLSPPVFARGSATPSSIVEEVEPATTASLLGVITNNVVSETLTRIAEIEGTGAKKYTLIIDSPGGYVDPGLRLSVVMDSFVANGGSIKCIVTGEAMSMAFYILGSCTERYVMAHSQLLWHPIRINFDGPITGEKALEIGQSLLVSEQSMKENLINRMGVEETWFHMHWRAETTHHGIDLANQAPQFIKVIAGISGVKYEQAYWNTNASIFDLAPNEDNGQKFWGRIKP